MAKNQVYKFVDVLSVPVPEGTKSGDPVIVNADTGLVGVAETDRSERSDTGADSFDDPWGGGNGAGYASVSFKGGYRLTVTGALAVGDPVYFSADGKSLSASGTGPRLGWSLTTKGSGEGAAVVIIDGAPATA